MVNFYFFHNPFFIIAQNSRHTNRYADCFYIPFLGRYPHLVKYIVDPVYHPGTRAWTTTSGAACAAQSEREEAERFVSSLRYFMEIK